MAPSSEGCTASGDQLREQLVATFGCPGNGSMNIAELQKLLHNLIELHVRYEVDRKENNTTRWCSNLDSPEDTAGAPWCLPEDTGSKQASVRSFTVKTNQEPEVAWNSNTKQHSEGIALSDCCPNNNPCDENVSGELSSGKDILSLRSSDFNVKSTSSTSSGCSMRICDEESSSDTKAHEQPGLVAIPNVAERVREIPDRVSHDDTGALSSPGGVTETLAQADVPISFPDLVAIMEGCKRHMETVKDEVLALKNRCQSQYEDLLKLAGSLDNLVERLDSQEPKVTKLETDTHCLGMLISDYEQNFGSIEKRLELNDTRSRQFERTHQRMDKERDAISGELRTIGEQANYLSNVKADKMDVQTELNRRALMTDLQQRVPYDVFNDGVHELTRFVTQMREGQYELEENLKTVQYELVKGLGSKASAQDVSQIRKQLVGVLARWQKAERSLQPLTGNTATQLIRGDFHSAAVALTGSLSHSTGSSTCLSCGIQTTLEGTKSAVPVAVRFVPSWKAKSRPRNAGGFHTICAPPERVHRTGSLSMVPKLPKKHKPI